MSKLKRYEEYKHDNGLYEDGFGEWVKYEDVKELEAKIAELEADFISVDDIRLYFKNELVDMAFVSPKWIDNFLEKFTPPKAKG